MYNIFENFEVEIFGESHASEVGVILSGIKSGEKVDVDFIQGFVDRRKSGLNAWSTPRKEADKVEILSGIENGVTNGKKIKAVIKNTAVRSSDYNELKYTPRPSHADFVCAVKDKSGECPSGGGRFSGRMTAPLCIAGAIAKSLLYARGVEVLSYIRSIGTIEGESFSSSEVTIERIKGIKTELKALSLQDKMVKEIIAAAKEGDSLGGVVDCMVFGMPIAKGDALFSGLEGRLAQSVFAIPGVKGVSFGEGFKISTMRGSVANDSFYFDSDGSVKTRTNRSGGINGGISNGMPITLSAAFRPTPSISLPQKTVNLKTGKEEIINIKGRHDACIAVRGAIALEAAVALSVLDIIL